MEDKLTLGPESNFRIRGLIRTLAMSKIPVPLRDVLDTNWVTSPRSVRQVIVGSLDEVSDRTLGKNISLDVNQVLKYHVYDDSIANTIDRKLTSSAGRQTRSLVLDELSTNTMSLSRTVLEQMWEVFDEY